MSLQISLSSTILAAAALVAGALVPLQAVSNAALGRSLGHPLWATLVSLFVSTLVVIPLIIALRVPMPSINQTAHMPLWAWFGGIAGAIYVTAALVLVSRLGATTFIVCVIAGQMLISLIIDHYGLMGLPTKTANVGRVIGVVMICLGMFAVQWFSVTSTSPPQEIEAHRSSEKEDTK